MRSPYPLFNWHDFHSNGSDRDQVSVCYNMTLFLQLIYRSGSEFLKSSINANETLESFFVHRLAYILAIIENQKKETHVTYFLFVLIWNPVLRAANPATQMRVKMSDM